MRYIFINIFIFLLKLTVSAQEKIEKSIYQNQSALQSNSKFIKNAFKLRNIDSTYKPLSIGISQIIPAEESGSTIFEPVSTFGLKLNSDLLKISQRHYLYTEFSFFLSKKRIYHDYQNSNQSLKYSDTPYFSKFLFGWKYYVNKDFFIGYNSGISYFSSGLPELNYSAYFANQYLGDFKQGFLFAFGPEVGFEFSNIKIVGTYSKLNFPKYSNRSFFEVSFFYKFKKI